MSHIYLLDTNTVSYIIKDKFPAARARLSALDSQQVGISCITEGELRYGLAKSGSDRRRHAVERLLGGLTIHPWGREAAAAYGFLRANQERIGRILEPLAMQIAAHAIALNATLVTHDAAFQQVTGLPAIEDWATDL